MAEPEQAGTSLATEQGNGETSEPATQSQTQPQVPEWVAKLDNLDETSRSKLARYKTVNDLAKSALEFDKKVGQAVLIPGKDATDQEKAAFYKRLGRPESKDGYALDNLFLADGVTKDTDTENRIREMAFDLGLNPENAKRLHKTFIDLANRGVAMMSETKEKAREVLRKEWSGDYDKNIVGVGNIIRKYGDAQTIQLMNSGPGNDPVILRFLAKIAKDLRSDTLETGGMPRASVEKDGSDLFPNSPEMTGANRVRRIS